jgi:S-adenosylmethionine decarboxylase
MDVGTEWLVEAAGCREESLKDPAALERLFSRIIAELGLKPLHAPTWHVFPEPGGVTGFVMLTESHLTCHTYPEYGIAAINLYCCRRRTDWPWNERLAEHLGATQVQVRVLERALPVEVIS